MTSIQRPQPPELTWWQKPLVALKIWRPEHRTAHHVIRDLPAPAPPPVTGAYGNTVISEPAPRRVPQRES